MDVLSVALHLNGIPLEKLQDVYKSDQGWTGNVAQILAVAGMVPQAATMAEDENEPGLPVFQRLTMSKARRSTDCTFALEKCNIPRKSVFKGISFSPRMYDSKSNSKT